MLLLVLYINGRGVNGGNERNRSLVNYSMIFYQRYISVFFITIIMLMSQCHEVQGRRESKRIEIFEDPKKASIVLERDIFLVSTEPSAIPTSKPSTLPSFQPTKEVSSNPSYQPTSYPTQTPTFQPSLAPTPLPSLSHSVFPSSDPSYKPTFTPTSQPSMTSTLVPSVLPTPSPSILRSNGPSSSPILFPTIQPTQVPSNEPTMSMLTLSPAENYPLGEVPGIDDPQARSYFNYNPNDINYGPGQPTQKVYHYNETKEETILVDIETEKNTWTLRNITNSTTNITTLVNVTETQTISNKIKKSINVTIPKSYEYVHYEGNSWYNVQKSKEYEYWKEFGMNRTLGNRCYSKPWRRQSPIDLCETHVNTECYEHHQIRNRGGDINLDDAEVELQILPSKLRIKYSKENPELDRDIGPIPPHADFPLNWNGYIPAVHIDIKIPSEHTICGERYAGEYQIFFYHPKKKHPIVQSILIEIHPQNRTHLHFQRALNEWQALFDLKQLECDDYQRRLRRDKVRALRRNEDISVEGASTDDEEDEYYDLMLELARERVNNPTFDVEYNGITSQPQKTNVSNQSISSSSLQNGSNETFPTATTCDWDSDHIFVLGDENRTCCDLIDPNMSWGCNISTVIEKCPNICRNLLSTEALIEDQNQTPSTSPTDTPRPRWNPFWPRIINSIHFYGYGGSLTEPPCSEWVAWRVVDTPMQISYDQWDQMRNILFNQVDETCNRSSAQWMGSVARPTQSLNERPLWKCTDRDYVSDVEKRAARAAKESDGLESP